MAENEQKPSEPSYEEIDRMVEKQREEIRKENERYDAQHPKKKPDNRLKRLLTRLKKQ